MLKYEWKIILTINERWARDKMVGKNIREGVFPRKESKYRFILGPLTFPRPIERDEYSIITLVLVVTFNLMYRPVFEW